VVVDRMAKQNGLLAVGTVFQLVEKHHRPTAQLASLTVVRLLCDVPQRLPAESRQDVFMKMHGNPALVEAMQKCGAVRYEVVKEALTHVISCLRDAVDRIDGVKEAVGRWARTASGTSLSLGLPRSCLAEATAGDASGDLPAPAEETDTSLSAHAPSLSRSLPPSASHGPPAASASSSSSSSP